MLWPLPRISGDGEENFATVSTGFIYANGIFPSAAWNRSIKGLAHSLGSCLMRPWGSWPS